jgi:hypothetical protein
LLSDGSNCSGSNVGKIKQKGNNVKVKIKNGAPNSSWEVFETCQDGSGCHAGCGFTSLGTVTSNGAGKGKAKLPRALPNPVHYDLIGTGPLYWAGIFSVTTEDGVAGAPASAGDPTN